MDAGVALVAPSYSVEEPPMSETKIPLSRTIAAWINRQPGPFYAETSEGAFEEARQAFMAARRLTDEQVPMDDFKQYLRTQGYVTDHRRLQKHWVLALPERGNAF